MNPNFGKYTPEEQQQAGAFLGVCGYIGEQDWGVPSKVITSREQLREEARAARILRKLYEYDRKKGSEPQEDTPPTDDEMKHAFYQTWKSQPALQRRYKAAEYIAIRVRMYLQNSTK